MNYHIINSGINLSNSSWICLFFLMKNYDSFSNEYDILIKMVDNIILKAGINIDLNTVICQNENVIDINFEETSIINLFGVRTNLNICTIKNLYQNSQKILIKISILDIFPKVLFSNSIFYLFYFTPQIINLQIYVKFISYDSNFIFINATPCKIIDNMKMSCSVPSNINIYGNFLIELILSPSNKIISSYSFTKILILGQISIQSLVNDISFTNNDDPFFILKLNNNLPFTEISSNIQCRLINTRIQSKIMNGLMIDPNTVLCEKTDEVYYDNFCLEITFNNFFDSLPFCSSIIVSREINIISVNPACILII